MLLGKLAVWPFQMRPRVSLFGLLLLVTAAACCSAYVGSEMRRERRLRAWYSGVEQRGGNVVAIAPGMVSVNLRGITLTEDDFVRIQELRADRCSLRFGSGSLNDGRLLSLASVSGLEDLSFDADDVSRAAVQGFKLRAPGCKVYTLSTLFR